MTPLVKPKSGVTTWSDVPSWIELGKDCTGKVDETAGRKRLYQECVDPGPSDGNCGVFPHRENRLQVRVDEVPVFCAYSLHYSDPKETVPPGHTAIAMIGEGEDALPFIKDCLASVDEHGALVAGLHRPRPSASGCNRF